MYLVGGNAVTHAKFLAALGGSHAYEGRLEAWYDGEKVADDITFDAGSVSVTGRNRERRDLRNVRVPASLWPSAPADPLSPYGSWVQAFVTVVAGATRFPEIPVFAGKVTVADWSRWAGHVEVHAVDPMWQVNRESFEDTRIATAGALIQEQILTLLREVFPEATLDDQTVSAATVPAGLSWSPVRSSRGRAIDDLAASIGAEVFARPDAVWPHLSAVIRPVPTLDDAVAWEFPDGDESIVVRDRRLQSGLTVVNRWIVYVERQDAPPLTVVSTDDNPGSPTRYGGPMGKLVDYYSSPLIGSEAQGQAAGAAKLAKSIGLARPRIVTVPANPALEAGDVLSIGVDGEFPTLHIADDFAIPLTFDPASMDIDTRSTGADE